LKADSYVFPYTDGAFDAVFLVSVFTHMLTGDVRNYIREIGRMLRPNGVCMLTAFLMDHGKEHPGLSFPYSRDDHHYYDRNMPEAAIGYYKAFFISEFARQGMEPLTGPLWGSWRSSTGVESSSGFPQDVLSFRKR
jgi:SAM-dependent methyltransferase